MKRLVLSFVLILLLQSHALAQMNPVALPPFTSSLLTQVTPTNVIGTGATYFTFAWWTQGTVSAGACVLKGALDYGFTIGITTIIPSQTVTSSGGSATPVHANPNYLKVDCSTSGGGTSITGGGSVSVVIYGFSNVPSFTSVTNIAIDAPVGSAPTSPPVPWGCIDGASSVSSGQMNIVSCDGNGHPLFGGLGVAGTPAGGVVSIQGEVSMTPVLATLTGTNTVQPGNTPNTTPWLFSLVPDATATTAFTPCYVKSGTGTLNDTSNHANCKASAGNFIGARAINTSSSLAYLRMYNLTTDPTCSSSTGYVESIPIPQSSGNGAGFIDIQGNGGFNYSTGISYCVTGAGANNDNSAPPAGVYVTIKLK